MIREKLLLHDSVLDLIRKMSEGNPGALTVLAKMVIAEKDEDKKANNVIAVLLLDDMNIRGTQIWIGYKDYCGQDLEKFIQCTKNHDPGMIAKINEEGLRGNHKEKAVAHGASFLLATERPMLPDNKK